MKIFVIIISIILSLSFIACSDEAAIEETISAWEKAIDDKNISDFKETLSPDSDLYVDVDLKVEELFATYFHLYDVEYANLDIDIDKPYADVLPGTSIYYDADDADIFFNIPSKFKMKKEEGFLSSISPDWRVYKYWDDANDDGVFDDSDYLWRKLQSKKK